MFLASGRTPPNKTLHLTPPGTIPRRAAVWGAASRRLRTIPTALVVLLFVLACSPDQPGEGPSPFTAEEFQRQVRDLYRQAQDAGENVPADTYEWARSDLERIGDWEYMVLRLDGASDEGIQSRLNELGKDRWEVFWMEASASDLRIFLKRPVRSYLRHLPLSELSRLLPGGSSAE